MAPNYRPCYRGRLKNKFLKLLNAWWSETAIAGSLYPPLKTSENLFSTLISYWLRALSHAGARCNLSELVVLQKHMSQKVN
jgi:hypothetical protein